MGSTYAIILITEAVFGRVHSGKGSRSLERAPSPYEICTWEYNKLSNEREKMTIAKRSLAQNLVFDLSIDNCSVRVGDFGVKVFECYIDS